MCVAASTCRAVRAHEGPGPGNRSTMSAPSKPSGGSSGRGGGDVSGGAQTQAQQQQTNATPQSLQQQTMQTTHQQQGRFAVSTTTSRAVNPAQVWVAVLLLTGAQALPAVNHGATSAHAAALQRVVVQVRHTAGIPSLTFRDPTSYDRYLANTSYGCFCYVSHGWQMHAH